MRKQDLKSSLNAFPQHDPSGKAPKTASVKFDLSAPDGEFTTPYIEHWVLQLHGVAPERINNPEVMNDTMNRVVTHLGLTQVSTHSHYFGPGVSTVIILSESHLSAHSWPELGYLHLDLVTCVRKLTGEGMRKALSEAFMPSRLQLTQLKY